MDVAAGYAQEGAPNDTALEGNTSGNSNDAHSGPPPYFFARIIEIYTMPFICTIGLIGNTLATLTFLQKPLRNTSCSLYLAARAVCDNIFLTALAIIWISGTFDLELNKVQVVCQSLVFLTYICAGVSVWLVVFVTVENYIRICHHVIVKRACTTKTAKILIVALCFVALATYQFPLWISNPDCSPSPTHFAVTQAFVYIDSTLTMAVPSLMMVILIIVIIYNLVKSFNRRERLKRLSVSTKSKNPMAKVTKMLLAVSIIFISLNLPSHVIRLRLLINSFTKETAQAPDLEIAIHSVSLLVYYLSLSINIFVYYIFGENFRKVFNKMFFGRQVRNRENSGSGGIEIVPLTNRSPKQSLTVLLNPDDVSQISSQTAT